MKRISFALPLLFSAAIGGPVAAQSLHGSPASVDKMFTRAVSRDLSFLQTSKSVYESVKDGELVMLSVTDDMTLDDVAYPFVLPTTRDFVTAFAKEYHQTCGERITVTSAARPRTEQPRNASPKSVHPTGMAVDFRKPSGACLTFLRDRLVQLEKQGIIEATEEKHPVHFHVAVLQKGAFIRARTLAVNPVTSGHSSVISAPVTMVASASSSVVTGSAGGEVETDTAAKAPAKPSSKVASTSSKSGSGKSYSVKKGDTLSGIAKRFGVSVAHLKAINGLKSSSLHPGQKLRVG